MKKAVILLALILIPIAVAQLDWSITDLRCGNGILDKYELCEKGLDNESVCAKLGENLTIAMACFDKHCTCLPKVNPVYCGNKRRDLNEMCDAGDPDDHCPYLGQLMGNVSLKCNPKTCGCEINETISDLYSTANLQKLVNASLTPAICGNKKIERNEECDPPNTLCTTNIKKPGICTEKCECVPPELLGAPEQTQPESPTASVTGSASVETKNETQPSDNVTATPVPEQPKEPGFFARLWDWFAGLFI